MFLMVLALVMCSIGTNAQERKLQVEKDGFRWYRIYKDWKYGAEDENGRTLIPTQYSLICYHPEENNQGYFAVEGLGTSEGVYDRNGNCIISRSQGYTSICKLGDSKKGYYYSVKKGNGEGVCDLNGNCIISTSQGYTDVCKCGDSKRGYYYHVEKDNGEGVCDLNGNCIISTSRGYTKVHKFGDSKEGYYYLVEKSNGWGVCDLNGKEKIFIDNVEVILPDYIQGKFYYSIKRNGLWGIVQANGQIYITPKYKSLWEEKGKFISDDTGTKRIVGYVSKITTSRNLLAVREEFRSQPSSADFEATPSLASSNSSSSSSSSSSVSSSSLSTQPAWLHRGWYYQSTDGIDINTGSRMSQLGGPVGTTKMQFTVYDDHLEVATEADVKKGNALKISFSGIENGWRVYRSVSGSGQWRFDERYYVSSNYDIKYIMNTSEYPIVKENESLSSYQKISSGQSGGYSSSGSYSSGSSYSSSSRSSGSSSVPRTECPNCKKGRRVYEQTISVPTFGLKTNIVRCSECGKSYDSYSVSHRHDRCNTCHGSGYLD